MPPVGYTKSVTRETTAATTTKIITETTKQNLSNTKFHLGVQEACLKGWEAARLENPRLDPHARTMGRVIDGNAGPDLESGCKKVS